MVVLRLTILAFIIIFCAPSISLAETAQDAFESSCYEDVGFVKDIEKQNLTCQCVGYHLRLYMPERLLKKELSDLKPKHLLKLKKSAAKSLIGCMDHFVGDLFHDVCEKAAYENSLQVDCNCMAEMGLTSLESHRADWMKQINEQKDDFQAEKIIGSDEVKEDIRTAMQLCQ